MSSSLSVVLFLLTFYFLLYFTFLLFLFMANSSDSMILNTLCNSANGTFVTLDDCLPDTGCEGSAHWEHCDTDAPHDAEEVVGRMLPSKMSVEVLPGAA